MLLQITGTKVLRYSNIKAPLYFTYPICCLAFRHQQPYKVLTRMEWGHALTNHPPWGCRSPRNPCKSRVLGAARTGAVMDGRTPTPADDWKAERDRLPTQMGFDTHSALVPCHLIDGGKGGIEYRMKTKMKKGSFWSEHTIMIKERQRERREGERESEQMPFRLFSARVKVKLNFTQHLLPNGMLYTFIFPELRQGQQITAEQKHFYTTKVEL